MLNLCAAAFKLTGMVVVGFGKLQLAVMKGGWELSCIVCVLCVVVLCAQQRDIPVSDGSASECLDAGLFFQVRGHWITCLCEFVR